MHHFSCSDWTAPAVSLEVVLHRLLLLGERKSVEPMASPRCPDILRQTHQSLHDIAGSCPWNDGRCSKLCAVMLFLQCRNKELGPIVDDTGFLKKGTHSVGVARQYRGQVVKQENCRVAVSLSITTMKSSLPICMAAPLT